MRVVQKTQHYTRQLLDYNEELVAIISHIEQDKRKLASELERTLAEKKQLEDKLHGLHAEVVREHTRHAELREHLAKIERASREFCAQYTEVEEQNSNLANLYVASYRLHGTLDRDNVLNAVREIIINLIGCEQFVVFEVAADRDALVPATSSGLDPERLRNIRLGAGAIGRTARDGVTRVAPIEGATDGDERSLTACIPLKLDGNVTGVIALFRLLPQKAGFQQIDHELFDLLATHAASALYSSTLKLAANRPA